VALLLLTLGVPEETVIADYTLSNRAFDLLFTGRKFSTREAYDLGLVSRMVDDGTACEIGIFSELVRTDPTRYRGVIGLATDWRIWRSRDAGAADNGINFFVGGAIEAYGKLVWSIDEVETALSEWQ